jgi:hypothetical protein
MQRNNDRANGGSSEQQRHNLERKHVAAHQCDANVVHGDGRHGGLLRQRVRMALGAERGHVLRLMLGDGLRPALYGLVVGLAASTGTVRLIESMLYGTQPLDPAIFAGVAATLLAVAALACLIPAWRASRIDPMKALRIE